MKKYLLGLFAVVLALGFSAFTTAKKTHHAKTAQVSYKFWYSSDDGSTVAHVLYSDVDNPITKDELSGYATIPCPIASGVVCVRGSNTAAMEEDNLPSSGTDSDIERANR